MWFSTPPMLGKKKSDIMLQKEEDMNEGELYSNLPYVVPHCVCVTIES